MPRINHWTCTLVAAFVAFAAALFAASPAASAADQHAAPLVVEPVGGSHTDRTGSYFVIDARPGSRVVERLRIRNRSNRTVRFRLAATDAVTGPYGGASYSLPGERLRRTGTWIALSAPTSVLRPGAAVTVPFVVRVPAGADGGHHLAGLAVWAPVAEAAVRRLPTKGASASIVVHTRSVIAVQVNTTPWATETLVVRGVTPTARPDGMYLNVAIDNTGTALTKANGTITVLETGLRQSFDVDTFVPRTSIAYPVKWVGPVRDGEYTARVELRYDGRVARWEGSVRVGKAVRAELEDRGVEAPAAPSSTLPAWAWSLAGAMAVAVLVLVRRSGAVAAAVSRGRRR